MNINEKSTFNNLLKNILLEQQQNCTGKLYTLTHESEMSEDEVYIYSSEAGVSDYYRNEKGFSKWKTKVLHRIAGIPFAIIYGIFLYLILKYMIFDDRETVNSNGGKVKRHSSAHINLQSDSDSNIGINLPFQNKTNPNNDPGDATWNRTQTVYFAEPNTTGIGYISSAFTVTVGIASAFSRGTRCTLILILPCAIAGRSRASLFTFILALLAGGPFNSLVHNFNELSMNPGCMYEAVTKMSKTSIMKLNSLHRVIRELRKVFENAYGLGDIFDSKKKRKSNFSFPRLSTLKGQMSIIKSEIHDFRSYVSITRKLLTIFSLILMIIDAIKYLRLYYSDSSFENTFIDQTVRRFWKEKGYEKMVPLRNWEINEGYKLFSSARLTKTEVHMSLRNTLPTIMFTFFAILVMVSDYLLATMLQSMESKDNITISYGGIDDTFKKVVKKILEKFNKATAMCATQPRYTTVNVYMLIYFLLIAAAISCMFEVYLSRMRANMCNFFYIERAEERADYLHFRMKVGRSNRRVHMKLTVRREIEKRERLREFYPWSHMKNVCMLRRKDENVVCPGCSWNVKSYHSKDIKFTSGDNEFSGKICGNCYLDYKLNFTDC